MPFVQQGLVSPDPAGVVLRARDYGIAFVVERAREDLVLVSVEHLQLLPRISVPDSASLVAACSNNFIALRVELDLRYFIFVTL